jgi:hypothetical protein
MELKDCGTAGTVLINLRESASSFDVIHSPNSWAA